MRVTSVGISVALLFLSMAGSGARAQDSTSPPTQTEPPQSQKPVSVTKLTVFLSGAVSPSALGQQEVDKGSTLADVLTIFGYSEADLSRVRVSRIGDNEVRTLKEYNLLSWLKPLPGEQPDQTQNPTLLDRDRIFVFVSSGGEGTWQPPAIDPVARNAALRAELLKRVDKDQDVRKRFIKDPKNQKIIAEMTAVDTDDTRWMHEVVQKYGWPGRSLVGRDGASAAFLLVQHADRDHTFQKRCLALMQAAARHGEVAKPDLALLTDRVLVAEHKKQIYGTQFTTTPDGGMVPSPIEDERNVDKRRKRVGLPSMSEYRKLLQQMYGTGKKPGSAHTPE